MNSPLCTENLANVSVIIFSFLTWNSHPVHQRFPLPFTPKNLTQRVLFYPTQKIFECISDFPTLHKNLANASVIFFTTLNTIIRFCPIICRLQFCSPLWCCVSPCVCCCNMDDIASNAFDVVIINLELIGTRRSQTARNYQHMWRILMRRKIYIFDWHSDWKLIWFKPLGIPNICGAFWRVEKFTFRLPKMSDTL